MGLGVPCGKSPTGGKERSQENPQIKSQLVLPIGTMRTSNTAKPQTGAPASNGACWTRKCHSVQVQMALPIQA